MPEMVDRRRSDNVWRKHVDTRLDESGARIDALANELKDLRATVDSKLTEGARRFDEFADMQKNASSELALNTNATLNIAGKLDAHIAQYTEFSDKLHPVVDIVETMQPGVIVIGKIRKFFGWLARQLRRLIVFGTPFGTAAWAIWYYVTGHGGAPK